jgi:hypothetical protein
LDGLSTFPAGPSAAVDGLSGLEWRLRGLSALEGRLRGLSGLE